MPRKEEWQSVTAGPKKAVNTTKVVTRRIRVFKPLMQFLEAAVPQRVVRKFSSLQLDVDVVFEEFRPSQELFVMMHVEVTSPRSCAETVEKALSGMEVITKLRQISTFVQPHRESALEKDQCASSFFDFVLKGHKITVIAFPDEKPDALVDKAKEFLSTGPSRQQFRAYAAATPSTVSETLAKNARKGGQELSFDEHIDNRIVATKGMSPVSAKQELRDILSELEANHPYDDIPRFFRHLNLMELHYILACLGTFELHNKTLALSVQVKDKVKLFRDATSEQFFTDRRPSVERDDVVTLVCKDTAEEFRTVVVFVQRDELWFEGDVLPESMRPEEDEGKAFGKILRSNDENAKFSLLTVVAQGAKFDIKFDPVKFTVFSDIREKVCVRHGDESIEFLCQRETPPACIEAIERLRRKLLTTKTYDDTNSGDDDGVNSLRLPPRSERGGLGSRSSATSRGRGGKQQHEDPLRYCMDDDSDLFEKLDQGQRLVVQTIRNPPKGLRKLLVNGPGGTGKTEALCTAVAWIVDNHPDRRILYVAPSQSACDVAARRILQLLQHPKPEEKVLFRLQSVSMHPLNSDPVLLPYSNIDGPIQFKDLTVSHKFWNPWDPVESGSRLRRTSELWDYNVIVTSLTNARKIDHPLHLVIADEAAQTHLLDGFQACRHVFNDGSLLVLAGDIKQNHPRCDFQESAKHVHQSFYSFLKKAPILDLRICHRAEGSLAKVLNEVLYNGQLQFAGDEANDACHPFALWGGHRNDPNGFRFIHLEEKDAVTVNNKEMECIVNCIETLLACYPSELEQDDFVVVSSSKEQQKCIRGRLEISGLKRILVTDIEEFQGNERKVLLASLVCNTADVAEAKRGVPFPDKNQLTTIITRGKQLCIFVGNAAAFFSCPRDAEFKQQLMDSSIAIDSIAKREPPFVFQETWTPLQLKRSIEVKAYVPLSERKRDLQFVSKEQVLENIRDYFIGVVVGYDEAYKRVRVRNLRTFRLDVLIDMDIANSNKLQWFAWAFPGDLVAVRIDPVMHRWWECDITLPIHYQVDSQQQLSPEVGDLDGFYRLRHSSRILTLDDFPARPVILDRKEKEMLHPTGTLCCILEESDLRAIKGNVRTVAGGARRFFPIDKRFPDLPCDGSSGTTAKLVRNIDGIPPFYEVADGITDAHTTGQYEPPFTMPRHPPLDPGDRCLIYPTMLDFGFCESRIAGTSDKIFSFFFPLAPGFATIPTGVFDSMFNPERPTQLPMKLQLLTDRGQEMLQIRVVIVTTPQGTSAVGDVSCKVVTAVAQVVGGAPPYDVSILENTVNFATAIYLRRFLGPLAFFVRQGCVFCHGQRSLAQPELWMLPTADQLAFTPYSHHAKSKAPIYTQIARYKSNIVDQMVLLQISLTLKAQRLNLDALELKWLADLPQFALRIQGWTQCGNEALFY